MTLAELGVPTVLHGLVYPLLLLALALLLLPTGGAAVNEERMYI